MTEELQPGHDVLVVIPCLNEARTLDNIFAALRADRAAEGLRIIVADGGSTDGSRELVEAAARADSRIVLMPNPKRIQSTGVNLAARLFGDGRAWLVRIDAHADYPANYVSGLVATAQRVAATSVVVPMLTRGETCFQRAAAAAQNSRLGAGGAAHRGLSGGGWVDHGHHALFALPAFLAAGGYDETFVANEDAEFDVRLTQAGGRVWLADELAITYHPRRTPLALFSQYLKHGAGRARTLLRHRQRPKLRQLLPVMVFPAVLLLAPAMFIPAIAAPAVIWTSGSLAYGAWLGGRARDPCALMAGPAAMIIHLAWSIGFWGRLVTGAGPGFAESLPAEL